MDSISEVKSKNNGWSLIYRDRESIENLIGNYQTEEDAINTVIDMSLEKGGKIFQAGDNTVWYDTLYSGADIYKGQIKLDDLKTQIRKSRVFNPNDFRLAKITRDCYYIKQIEFSKSPELKIVQSVHYTICDKLDEETSKSDYFSWLAYLPGMTG